MVLYNSIKQICFKNIFLCLFRHPLIIPSSTEFLTLDICARKHHRMRMSNLTKNYTYDPVRKQNTGLFHSDTTVCIDVGIFLFLCSLSQQQRCHRDIRVQKGFSKNCFTFGGNIYIHSQFYRIFSNITTLNSAAISFPVMLHNEKWTFLTFTLEEQRSLCTVYRCFASNSNLGHFYLWEPLDNYNYG